MLPTTARLPTNGDDRPHRRRPEPQHPRPARDRDRLQRIREHAPRRQDRPQLRIQRDRATREKRPDHLGTLRRTAAASHAPSPPAPPPLGRSGDAPPRRHRLDRRADHRHLILTTQQTQIRQQHMRARHSPDTAPAAAETANPPTNSATSAPAPTPTAPTPPDTTDTPTAPQPAQPRPSPPRRLRSSSGATSGIQRALPTQRPSWREGSRAFTNTPSLPPHPDHHHEQHEHPRRAQINGAQHSRSTRARVARSTTRRRFRSQTATRPTGSSMTSATRTTRRSPIRSISAWVNSNAGGDGQELADNCEAYGAPDPTAGTSPDAYEPVLGGSATPCRRPPTARCMTS